jgi:hypothetical protein
MDDTIMSHPVADDHPPSIPSNEIDLMLDAEPWPAIEDADPTEPDTPRKVS